MEGATMNDWRPIETAPLGVEILCANRKWRRFVALLNDTSIRAWRASGEWEYLLWHPLPDCPKEVSDGSAHDALGLMHDRIHKESGAVRAAKSVIKNKEQP